jgi:hypothetical protein
MIHLIKQRVKLTRSNPHNSFNKIDYIELTKHNPLDMIFREYQVRLYDAHYIYEVPWAFPT